MVFEELDDKQMVTREYLAQRWQVSPRTIDNYCSSGLLTYTGRGRGKLFTGREVKRYERKRTVKAVA